MRLIAKNCRSFSITKRFYDSLYLNDPDHEGNKIASSSIHTQPIQIKNKLFNPVQFAYQSTKLQNGITVLTESVSVPSNVHLGVFYDVGSRDENAESSGAMLLLKHVYLKTAVTTNQTVNYGIAQMAGSTFQMDYNNENAYYRINCHSHDVTDVFSMLVDCALEPKNVVACAVGRLKNTEAHQVDAESGGNYKFNDHIYTAAYGGKTLGNPTYGRKSNIANLSAEIIQKFQMTNMTNDRIVISATGIENHKQFVDLVTEKFHFTQLRSTKPQRETSKYVGGEIRNFTDSNKVHVALAFEGVTYKDAYTLLLAKEILGEEGRSTYTKKNILDKNVFVDDVQSFSKNFTDSGLFGLKLAGSASHVNDIVKLGAKTLCDLRNITQSDIAIAKASLKSRISRQLTQAYNRNEQMSKSLYYLNKYGQTHRQQIDRITASQVNSAVSKALKSPLTFVVEGGEVNAIGSYDKVSQLFN